MRRQQYTSHNRSHSKMTELRKDEQLAESSIDQSARLAAAHRDYTNLIDELKNELDSLSTAVDVARGDWNNMLLPDSSTNEANYTAIGPQSSSLLASPQHNFELTLQELLTQNDRLQAALERAGEEKMNACADALEKAGKLEEKIQELQEMIVEKENCIKQLKLALTLKPPPSPSGCDRQKLDYIQSQLEQSQRRHELIVTELEKARANEKAMQAAAHELNDELLESKRKHTDLICHARRLASLLKTQEDHRMELSGKFETMENCYKEQSTKLRSASSQLQHLIDRSSRSERELEEHEMERGLLRDELLGLKQKEASMQGQLSSVEVQLRQTSEELDRSKEVIEDLRAILHRNDAAHAEALRRLEETTDQLRKQSECTAQEYRLLQHHHKKQTEMCEQHTKIIDSFNCWKEEQLKADAEARDMYKQYEEHIRLLLEEKQSFIEHYRDLRSEYSILEAEMGRLKLCNATASSPALNNIDSQMKHRVNMLRDTYLRVADTRTVLEGHKPLRPTSQTPKPDAENG